VEGEVGESGRRVRQETVLTVLQRSNGCSSSCATVELKRLVPGVGGKVEPNEHNSMAEPVSNLLAITVATHRALWANRIGYRYRAEERAQRRQQAEEARSIRGVCLGSQPRAAWVVWAWEQGQKNRRPPR
jgi:hypothetical protein